MVSGFRLGVQSSLSLPVRVIYRVRVRVIYRVRVRVSVSVLTLAIVSALGPVGLRHRALHSHISLQDAERRFP